MGEREHREKRLSMTVLMTPDKANFSGNVHGGEMLKMLDEVAYACGSESLWAEARQRNVLVMAVCPGFTKTEFFDVAGMKGWYTKFAQTSADVVAISIKALRRRRPFVVCGWLNWLTSLLPRFVSRRMIVVGSETLMRPPKARESAGG
jgi:hypothetical protein